MISAHSPQPGQPWPPPASPASTRSANITRSSATGVIPPPNHRSNTLPVIPRVERVSEDFLRVGRRTQGGSTANPATPIMNSSSPYSDGPSSFAFGKNGWTTPDDGRNGNDPQNPSLGRSTIVNSQHKHSPSMPTELNSMRRNLDQPSTVIGRERRPSYVTGIPRQLDFGTGLGGIDLAPSSSNANTITDSKFINSVVGLGFKDNESNLDLKVYAELNNQAEHPPSNKSNVEISSGSNGPFKNKRTMVRNFFGGIKESKARKGSFEN